MNEFSEFLKTPSWWFSAIVVGVLVNLISNNFSRVAGRINSTIRERWLLKNRKNKKRVLILYKQIRQNPVLLGYYINLNLSYMLLTGFLVLGGYLMIKLNVDSLEAIFGAMIFLLGVFQLEKSTSRSLEIIAIKDKIYSSESIEVIDDEIDQFNL